MTTKHTAGPWEVAEGHAGWLVVGDVKATSHVVIADVPDEDDAHLIAAAPTMIEALKDAGKRLRGAGMLGGEDDPVVAAIAKAIKDPS
jgi:hypothetical protein